MKRSGLYGMVFIFMLPLFIGCVKQEHFPDIPQIELAGYMNVFDTGQYAVKGILSISFTDGNGDIGLNSAFNFPPYDSASPYYYNLIISYYEKQKGIYKEVVLNPPFNARIPVLNSEFPGKAIKGVITDTLGLNPRPVYDTIRFEVFIYDRALNKSNVVTTPDIILRRP